MTKQETFCRALYGSPEGLAVMREIRAIVYGLPETNELEAFAKLKMIGLYEHLRLTAGVNDADAIAAEARIAQAYVEPPEKKENLLE